MLLRFNSVCCGCDKVRRIFSLRFLSKTSAWLFEQDVKDGRDSGSKKYLDVAVIGQPNAGKSTLINCMVGERVSVVTSREHTTRRSTKGILNIGDTQLVFTDTPGTVSYQEARRLKMHKDHIRTPLRASVGADLIAVVVDTYNKYTRTYIHDNILNILRANPDTPSILVMNKVDLVNKTHLIPLGENLTRSKTTDQMGIQIGGWERFEEVHYVSANRGHGVQILLDYFVSCARVGEWEFDEHVYSDAGYDFAISEVLREKLLTMIGQEIPWQVKQNTLIFSPDETTGTVRIVQQMSWPRSSQRRYVLEKEPQLRIEATKVLEKMFRCQVDLQLIVSQKNNMTKDDVHFS